MMKHSKYRWILAAFFVAASALVGTVAAADGSPARATMPTWSDAGVSLALVGLGSLAVTAPQGATGPATAASAAVWLDAGASLPRNLSAGGPGALLEVVWKSDRLGAAAGYDYDGWRLDFEVERGRLATVREFEIGGPGPREAAVYRVLRGEGLVILSRQVGSKVEPPQPFATLQRSDGGWQATSATQRSSYLPLAGGGLGIEREVYGGARSEDYRPGGKGLVRDGTVERRGFLEAGPPVAWVERKAGDAEGILDRMYWYDKMSGDSMSVSIGEVEPVAETGFRGASAFTGGPDGLENLVIADLILGLDRRATPVLALAWLGELPLR
jgi:hypothetical protein